MPAKVRPNRTTVSTPVDWLYLLSVLPPIVWRSRWDQVADEHGLPFKRGYMQNLDSQGLGPAKVIFGNRVGYTREALVAWLRGRQKAAA
jgi:hypothetical protein